METTRMPGSSPVDHTTLEHLWNAANELQAIAPTVSQRLAATLTTSVPEDGMSSFAKRKHCNKCAALMSTSRVRVRKVVKKTRRRCEAFRNVIIITCQGCGTSNVERGVRRDYRPEADEAEMIKFRRRVLRKARKAKNNRVGKRDDANQSVEQSVPDTDAASARNASDKKKRRKSKGNSTEPKAGSQGGLTASFLFDPL